MLIDTREDAKWTVYVHIVPRAISGYDYDKYYVGITSRSIKKRWGTRGQYYRAYFKEAIDKYGWNNIEHYIVATRLTKSEADSLEISLVKALDSYGMHGYNLTNGGDGTSGLHNTWSEERKKRTLENHIAPSGKDHALAKPVYQFDKNGLFIQKYDAISEAARDNNVSHSTIDSAAYYGNYGIGYIWVYEKDVCLVNGIYTLIPPLESWSVNKKCVPCYQFSKDGSFMARYNSLSDAHRKTGVSISTIQRHMNNECMTGITGDYFWCKESDVYYDNNICKSKKKPTFKDFTIYAFDAAGNYICCYASSTIASMETGESTTRINDMLIKKCKPNKKSKYSTQWRYSEDVQELPDGSFLMLR